MNKLGFAIELASQGAGNAIECNKDQWTNKVVDIREYLKLFNGLQGTDNIVTFMSFDEGGCFLTQLRAISGRLGDFLSGWIYIPNNIEIPVEDVLKAYNFVSKILSQSNLSDLKDKINDFFSEEFTQKNYTDQYKPSFGEEYGVRFLDQYYSLKEILDTNRYQPYYSKYKAIFLIDKNCEVKIASEQATKFKDLTELSIEKTYIFKNPSLEDVRLLGKGVKIVFKDKREFVTPLLTKKGEKIQLFAIRDGFEAITLPIVTIEKDEQTLIINPQIGKWQKKVTTSMFSIWDRKKQSLDQIARIYVNNTDITNHTCYLFEDECKEADVVVMANDFEDKRLKVSLLLGNVSIEMNRKSNIQQYPIILKNGSIANMTIESKSLKSQYSKDVSPLEGYSYSYEHEALGLSSGYAWKQRLYGFVAAIILGVSLLGYVAFDRWSETHRFKFGLPPWEEIKYTEQVQNNPYESTDNSNQTNDNSASDSFSIEKAIKYLDENDVWVKTDMEQYSDLKGLFDDLNNFHLETIANFWSTKLQTSETLNKIIEVANKNRQKEWDPRQGEHKPTYNKESDERINVTNYINWLDKDQSVSSSTTSQAKASQAEKSGTENNGGL